jgi:hypothetical protein
MANKFKSFSEFFDYIVKRKALDIPLNKKSNYMALYNMTFNQWLQENKGWEYGNEKTYLANLTKDNWLLFLLTESESRKKVLKEIATTTEAENKEWDIKNIIWQIDYHKVYDSDTFKTFVDLFNKRGESYKGNGINAWIYSPSVAYILGNTLLPCVGSINETVNGFIFSDAYLDGFKEGTQYFDSNYNVKANTVYLIKDEGFVSDLNSKYKEWSIEADSYPITLTNKIFKNIGYHSGLVFAAKELAKKYPSIFETKVSVTPPTETKTEQGTTIKFIAKEYALAYIFDLYSNGKQIPSNRIEGGLNKKELKQIGYDLYQFDNNKDTFYRAVKQVANNDLNKQKDLAYISLRWIEAVKTLSKDWNKTQKYLQEKKLIGE